MAAALQRLGFEVSKGMDLDRMETELIIRDFAKKLPGADVALFFYAGHGMQVARQNYLIPVDAQLSDETDLHFEATDINLVLNLMEREPRVNLIFLDACRDNPFADKLAKSSNRSAVSLAKGLGRVQAESGTFVAFSTQPDAVASDGSGRNSPFTTALLTHIAEPGRSISDLMIEVRNEVIAETGGKQVPWDSSSLTDRFAFAPEAAAEQEQTQQTAKGGEEQAEKDAYQQAVEVGSCGAYEAFQRRYPGSFYADLAKERANAACAAPQSEQMASAPPKSRSVAEPKKSGICETGPFEVDYCTSSALPTSAANHYDPAMMFDGNRATAWVEADKGDGVGETITLHFGSQRSLVGFEVINGYDKDQKIWSANSRVAELEAETGDGQVQQITLKDVRGASRFDFHAPVETSWLRLTIKSVYPGAKYRDTAISELYPIFAD
jgi:Caspase domain